MNYRDIQPPMTAAELEAADTARRARDRLVSNLCFLAALACLAFAIWGSMPVDRGPVPLFAEKTVVRAWSPGMPPWIGVMWITSFTGTVLLVLVGIVYRMGSHLNGEFGAESQVLDAEAAEQLYAIAADVPEVHSLVAAWYAEGRCINVRVFNELLQAKSAADAAADRDKLQSEIAGRFARSTPSAH